MSYIVVYQDRSGASGEKLARFLRQDFGEAEACVEDVAALKEKLCARKVSALVVLTKAALSPELEDFLGSNRNHGNLHDAPIVVAHAKLEAAGAQRSLLLGATHVIEEPVDSELYTELLRAELGEGPRRPKPRLEPLAVPMRCLADAYGRIGRIEKSPAGNLLVETSLDLRPGDRIELHHRIASDLRQEKLHYQVLEKSARGLYYRFAYGYHLEWLRSEEQARAFGAWLEAGRANFSVPKIKVLFILGDRSAPPALNTELFSTYRLAAGQLSPALLDRLEPQVIVRAPLPAETGHILQSWVERADASGTIVLDDVPPEERGPAGEEAWRGRLIAKLEPFVKASFQATTGKYLFLSRGSPYSSFAVGMEAEIHALAWRHLQLRTRLNLAPGAQLQLHLPFAEGGADPIFVRVEERLKEAGGEFEFLCLICFLSPDQRRRITSGETRLRPVPPSLVEESFPEAEERMAFLRASSVKNRVLLALALGLALALAGALWRYLQPGSEGGQAGNPEAQGGLSSYDRFGKSVRKSLHLESGGKQPPPAGEGSGGEAGEGAPGGAQ